MQDAGINFIKSWSGNQSRFSRIKYAFLHGVLGGVIKADSKVACLLGPGGRDHLDTITVHNLDARSIAKKELGGHGSRHRAAAGITEMTDAVAVVVSESTGRVTIFDKGRIIASLEPVISRRLV